MDKNTLPVSTKRSRAVLNLAFIVLGASMLGIFLFAYAGATHQAVIPGDIAKGLGLVKQNKIAVIYVNGQMEADKSARRPGLCILQRYRKMYARRDR